MGKNKGRYLAVDGINGDHEYFDTIKKAQEYLEESFIDSYDHEYHPDYDLCKIYELKQIIEMEVIDKQSNYKYLYEDDIPEDDEESEAWPYDTSADEICQHKFIEPTF